MVDGINSSTNSQSLSDRLGLNGTTAGDVIDSIAAATGLDQLLSGDAGLNALNAMPDTLQRFTTTNGGTVTVKRGDTLDSLAKANGTTWQALKALNPQISNADLIRPGQKITLPANATQNYTVRSGDTLSAIATRFGTTPQAIKDTNPRDVTNINRIYPGDQLRIPGNGGAQGARVDGAGLNAKDPVQGSTVSPVLPSATIGSGKIDLRQFFDPTKGSNAAAAIVIGNAEGTRTPSGGKRDAYAGHIDPGNGKGNRGSFSYQHGTGLTPEQADKAQLTKLSKLIPGYEAAAKAAGLDPNNATLATAYFDLFNQSQTAAARFLDQIGYLKTAGISAKSVTELRFRSFINPETGQRWTPGTASGFQKIANEKHGGKASEAQFQAVIRADQARRTSAMTTAMNSQGIGRNGSTAKVPELTPTSGTAAIGAQPAEGGVLSKWPVSNPKLNAADKAGEGDGHFGTHRKRGQHGGIDLVGKLGDPIFAAGKGVVVDIQPRISTTFGYQVVIDHGNGVFTQYAHLQPGSIKVQPGDEVKPGQQIAGMGRSGNTPSSGDTHLHFEVRIGSSRPAAAGGKTVDPLRYLGQPN